MLAKPTGTAASLIASRVISLPFVVVASVITDIEYLSGKSPSAFWKKALEGGTSVQSTLISGLMFFLISLAILIYMVPFTVNISVAA